MGNIEERIARLEAKISNGLAEDILEIKETLKELSRKLEEITKRQYESNIESNYLREELQNTREIRKNVSVLWNIMFYVVIPVIVGTLTAVLKLIFTKQ